MHSSSILRKIGINYLQVFENPEKTSQCNEQKQQQTQPTYSFFAGIHVNPGHIDGNRMLSPLRHPCTKGKSKKGWFLKADTKEVTISKVNCRQYCCGLLGLISAVLMLGWKLSYEATPNDPTNVISSKPRRSALTSN